MARFYVVQKSNWQGDNWKPVAGPFASRQEADNSEPAQGYHPMLELGGIDIKVEKHAKIVSRTQLAQMGFPNTPDGNLALAEALFKPEP